MELLRRVSLRRALYVTLRGYVHRRLRGLNLYRNLCLLSEALLMLIHWLTSIDWSRGIVQRCSSTWCIRWLARHHCISGRICVLGVMGRIDAGV